MKMMMGTMLRSSEVVGLALGASIALLQSTLMGTRTRSPTADPPDLLGSARESSHRQGQLLMVSALVMPWLQLPRWMSQVLVQR